MPGTKELKPQPAGRWRPRFPAVWLDVRDPVAPAAGPLTRRQLRVGGVILLVLVLLAAGVVFWRSSAPPPTRTVALDGRQRVTGRIEALQVAPGSLTLTLAIPGGTLLNVRCDTAGTSVFQQGGVLTPMHLRPGQWVSLEHEDCVASQIEVLPRAVVPPGLPVEGRLLP